MKAGAFAATMAGALHHEPEEVPLAEQITAVRQEVSRFEGVLRDYGTEPGGPQHLAALRAALETLEALGSATSGRQPIDTAPRDGTPVALWRPMLDGGEYRIGRWKGQGAGAGWYPHVELTDLWTEWAPLP